MSLKIFKDLIKLTAHIKNKKLRAQVVNILKNPQNNNYPNEPVSLEDCPGGPWHHTYRGGLVDHLFTVTTLSLEIAITLKEIYNEDINIDYLVASCLLHDIMKIYDYAYIKGKNKVIVIDNTIRHAEFGEQFLLQKKIPLLICKIVGQHIPWRGEDVIDMTFELRILLASDKIDSNALFRNTLLFDNYIISSIDF
ncbi:MAG: hypothetical protein COW47_02030 [Candidatus Huberarchaeum crystalense]|uniref:HD domain-containing protein n=1 Tax=Huberarchaeum crystalense TaxID=2014257 RepID=A0A2G9LIV2_HUBC1|nr:HD domain-containing protein [archaeon]OIP20309.1 MAG: hypothetical protein AUJ91_01690 [archaeon CG2_30_31_98]PIN66444.1 MAG: hypothetical protein COW69_02170 [Candidatus Huberarchaeum crystalense]NCS98154.1 HD domain-containing protein [archaeon]PIV13714.1 MAG: hypothetical protein COS45_01320 [Candidatus Huberarchaeum crystalense]